MPSESSLDRGVHFDVAIATHRVERHRDKGVRAAVAQNPATPTAALERLAATTPPPPYGVAQNADPRSSEIALQAHDPDVRVILAQRHDLDERTLQRLLGDLNYRVRKSLAASSGAPAHR